MTRRAGWPDLARHMLRRWPDLGRAALGTLDVVYQVTLLPFRRPARHGVARERQDLVDRTDDYNQAAERYFARFENTGFLLDKPFGDLSQTPKHLIDAGVLLQALRLQPGDTVLELGAGSGWLSHMLNRCGCRTIAVDVSPTALGLGRTLFERDPRTNWSLEPRFLSYDGHRLPVDDGSCDRVVINDAFHHVPNQRELLREMHRVLTADGLVAMSEPGRGHADAAHSRDEAGTGVLENELRLEDLAAIARACGFEAAGVVVASALANQEIPADALPAFMGGRGFANYWKAFCAALEQHHYIVLHKGSPRRTTRRPGRLSARIEVTGVRGERIPAHGELTVRAGEPLTLVVALTNTGDTEWLSGAGEAGWTRLGAHLRTATGSRRPIDFDWYRRALPRDVPPGERLNLDVELPALASPGDYLVEFDPVVEGLTWFADRGSHTAAIGLRVR